MCTLILDQALLRQLPDLIYNLNTQLQLSHTHTHTPTSQTSKGVSVKKMTDKGFNIFLSYGHLLLSYCLVILLFSML